MSIFCYFQAENSARCRLASKGSSFIESGLKRSQSEPETWFFLSESSPQPPPPTTTTTTTTTATPATTTATTYPSFSWSATSGRFYSSGAASFRSARAQNWLCTAARSNCLKNWWLWSFKDGTVYGHFLLAVLLCCLELNPGAPNLVQNPLGSIS